MIEFLFTRGKGTPDSPIYQKFMDIILSNLGWMSFNIFLAFVPVLFGWIMLKNRSLTIKIITAAIWITFLPNTLYLLTDITHFFEDARILRGAYLGIDLLMYLVLIVLGVFTFTIAMYPFERLVFPRQSKKKIKRNIPAFFILNFIVGFGMVLGRVQRTNSWEVFTDIEKVLVGSLATISSLKLMFLAIIFAVLCQVIYSTFAKVILKNVSWK